MTNFIPTGSRPCGADFPGLVLIASGLRREPVVGSCGMSDDEFKSASVSNVLSLAESVAPPPSNYAIPPPLREFCAHSAPEFYSKGKPILSSFEPGNRSQ